MLPNGFGLPCGASAEVRPICHFFCLNTPLSLSLSCCTIKTMSGRLPGHLNLISRPRPSPPSRSLQIPLHTPTQACHPPHSRIHTLDRSKTVSSSLHGRIGAALLRAFERAPSNLPIPLPASRLYAPPGSSVSRASQKRRERSRMRSAGFSALRPSINTSWTREDDSRLRAPTGTMAAVTPFLRLLIQAQRGVRGHCAARMTLENMTVSRNLGSCASSL